MWSLALPIFWPPPFAFYTWNTNEKLSLVCHQQEEHEIYEHVSFVQLFKPRLISERKDVPTANISYRSVVTYLDFKQEVFNNSRLLFRCEATPTE
jgi:hypothetical protein